jgi:hypothetical protein
MNLSDIKPVGSKVKSVQRGILTISGTGVFYANVTITAVDITKSRLNCSGWYGTSATGSPVGYRANLCTIKLLNSTTVQAQRGDDGTESASAVWELIEWENL